MADDNQKNSRKRGDEDIFSDELKRTLECIPNSLDWKITNPSFNEHMKYAKKRPFDRFGGAAGRPLAMELKFHNPESQTKTNLKNRGRIVLRSKFSKHQIDNLKLAHVNGYAAFGVINVRTPGRKECFCTWINIQYLDLMLKLSEDRLSVNDLKNINAAYWMPRQKIYDPHAIVDIIKKHYPITVPTASAADFEIDIPRPVHPQQETLF